MKIRAHKFGSVVSRLNLDPEVEISRKVEARSGQVVVIRGKVEGNVTAKEKVELAAPARLIGNVDSPRLVVTEGVVFDGDCSMGVAKQTSGGATPPSISADKAMAAQAPKLQADSKS